jgi:hypothetical protein
MKNLFQNCCICLYDAQQLNYFAYCKFQRSCHLPAPGRNFVTAKSYKTFLVAVRHGSINTIKQTHLYYSKC